MKLVGINLDKKHYRRILVLNKKIYLPFFIVGTVLFYLLYTYFFIIKSLDNTLVMLAIQLFMLYFTISLIFCIRRVKFLSNYDFNSSTHELFYFFVNEKYSGFKFPNEISTKVYKVKSISTINLDKIGQEIYLNIYFGKFNRSINLLINKDNVEEFILFFEEELKESNIKFNNNTDEN